MAEIEPGRELVGQATIDHAVELVGAKVANNPLHHVVEFGSWLVVKDVDSATDRVATVERALGSTKNLDAFYVPECGGSRRQQVF